MKIIKSAKYLSVFFIIVLISTMLIFTSCVPVCSSTANVDYENLESNLNATNADKKLDAALERDYYEAACEAVADGADVNKTASSIYSPLGEHDYSPITKCIVNGNTKLAEMLLNAGADPNYNNEACSLLVYAIREQRYDIANNLIEYGADVNYSVDGDSPLSEFIKSFNYSEYPIVTMSSANALFNSLKNKGAVIPQSTLKVMISNADRYDLNYLQKAIQASDYSPESPTKEIIFGDSDAAMAYLDKTGSIDDDSKKYLIYFAAAFCDERVIERLINLGCDINTIFADGVGLLSVAARYNSPEVVEYLYNQGVYPMFGGNSIKFCDYAAVLNKNSDSLNYLYKLRETNNYSALCLACQIGNIDYVNLNINYIKTLDDAEKQKLVYLAAFDDSLEIIKALKSAGIENFMSVSEYIGCMSVETIEYLLKECDLSPNAVDTEDTLTAPFRFAVASGDLEKVKLFLKYNADVNQTYPEQCNYFDKSPIFTAVYYSTDEIAEYLIKNGADMEEQDEFGYTPLMSAVFATSYNMAKVLIDNGADLTVKNYDNQTAVDMARSEPITRNDEKMMDILANQK